MEKIYDGCFSTFGVNQAGDILTPSRERHWSAVNRSFRGGRNQTRPPIRDIELSFDSDETEEAFSKGAVSGAAAYTEWRGTSKPCLVVAVHDRLVRILVIGRVGHVSTLKSGLTTGYMLSWFAQSHDRLYWQNDIDRPVAWDGVNPAQTIPDESDKMPKGSAMAYANGRLAVTVGAGSYMILSDYIYGNGLFDTKGVESFIEYQYFDDLGAIGTYAELGPVTGIIAPPQTDSVNGQGAYLVLCRNGIWQFDSSGARTEWLYSNRQRKMFEGVGCPAPNGFCLVNKDVYFLSTDGSITSFRRQVSELELASGLLPISREVSSYLGTSSPEMLKFASMAYHDSRLLASCNITTAPSELGGFHRFGQGMVSLDMDRIAVSSEGPGFSWDGLWTGPNPIQLLPLDADSRKRLMCLSHDDDGINRLYEIGSGVGNDECGGKTRVILGSFETVKMFSDQAGDPVTSKKLTGVKLMYSGAIEASLEVEYRPDFYPKYRPLGKAADVECVFGDGELPFYEADSGIVSAGNPAQECREDNQKIIDTANVFQLRVRTSGAVTVRRISAEAARQKIDTTQPCREACKKVEADDYDPFGYKLKSNGN